MVVVRRFSKVPFLVDFPTKNAKKTEKWKTWKVLKTLSMAMTLKVRRFGKKQTETSKNGSKKASKNNRKLVPKHVKTIKNTETANK